MLHIFKELASNIGSLFSSFGIADFLDICLVTFIIYSAIKFIRQTRAFQLVKGILLLGIIYIVVRALKMQVSTYIMSRVFKDVVLVMILLFQSEIRHVLERVGTRRRLLSGRGVRDSREMEVAISEVCKACAQMSDKKIGALIVFEKETPLGEIINTGNKIDALATGEMIGNIFYPKAPLHDGAAVIRANRVVSAGCILPLTQNPLTSDLGTRHRAAVGVSEVSDAVVVVVSEETGTISVAVGGKLERGLTDGDLRAKLMKMFVDDKSGEPSTLKKIFGGKKNG